MLDVYVAPLPVRPMDSTPLLPRERQEQIDGVSNAALKKEKYFVWRLLEKALSQSLGIKMENAELSLTRPQSEYVITGEALRGVSINGKSFGSHYPQRDPDSADTGNNGAGNSPIFGSDDSEGSITVKITAASGTATITTNENAITPEGEVQTRNEE